MEAESGHVLLDLEIPFDLELDVVADAATSIGSVVPQEVLRFKRDERTRIADIQEAALRRVAL